MPAPKFAINTTFTNGMTIVGVIDRGEDGPARYFVDGIEGAVEEAVVRTWEVDGGAAPVKPHSGQEPAE